MKQNSGQTVHRFSLRKTSFGLVSATIASLFMLFSFSSERQVFAEDSAKTVHYRYIAEDELTASEKQLIVNELPKLVEEGDNAYYLIYKPKQSVSEGGLPATGDTWLGQVTGALVGAGLLILAIRKGRKGKKEFAGLFILGATGSLLLAPPAFSLTNQTLARFNQELSISVGEQLPEPMAIEGYRYIGYIKESKSDEIAKPIHPNSELLGTDNAVNPDKPSLAVEHVDSVQTEPVAYEIQEVPNSELLAGETVVSQEGVDGVRTIVTRRYTVDGQVVKIEEISNTITTPATPRIVQVGTKVVEEVAKDAPSHELPSLDIVESDTSYTEPVAYETQEVPNSELLAGEMAVSQEGVEGVRTIVTRSYTVDGQVVKTEEISNTITTPATPRIVQVGTKVVEEVPKDAPSLELPSLDIVERDTTRTEPVAYETQEVPNSELPAGEMVVSQEGVDGERTIVTRSYTVDGQVVKTEEISNTITTPATPRIVQVGTKVVEEVPKDAPSHELPSLDIVESDTSYTEAVAYDTLEIPNSELLAGETVVSQEGVDGERTIVTRSYTVDGQVVKTEEISNEITTDPRPKIVQVGTKVVEEVPKDAPSLELPSLDIVERDTTRTEPVAYETQEVPNSELLAGETVVSQEGVEGVRTIIIRSYIIDGQVVKTEEISNEITTDPRPKIIQVGTKVKEIPTITITSIAEDENAKSAEASFELSDRTQSYISAVAQLYQGDQLVREIPITDVTAPLALTGLDYYTDYSLKTIVTYNVGKGPETKLQESTQDFRLDYKKIEIKDIDQVELYGLDNGHYRRQLSLTSESVNLDNYFVKIKSDRFKELLLPISKIEEVEIDGQTKYKLTVETDELVQDTGKQYDKNYSFYVDQRVESQNGVYTSFKELLTAIEANPAGTYTLGADMTADEVDLATDALSYVPSTFTGRLNGTHNGKSYAIYNLIQPLFNVINNATIENVDLIDVAITSKTEKVGALAKTATGSQIRNVSVEGSLSAPTSIGGLVYLANGATKITNSSFKGQLVAIGTNSGGSNIGGIAGWAKDNHTTLSQVQADVAITLSAKNNNYRAGALVGHIQNSARLQDGVAKGTIVNLTTAGQVGGVVGSTYNAGFVNNVVSTVQVTNGDQVHGDTAFNTASITNTFVTGSASGAADKWSTQISETEAASKIAAMGITATVADSLNNQAKNLYSVDYSLLDKATPERAIAYANMEKLLPFYNKEYIVYLANKIALTDKLAQTRLLDVVPMVGNQIVTDPNSQKRAINRIMLHYADNTVAYLDVAFKEDFVNNHVSDYTIVGTDLLYTPETFLSNYDGMVHRLTNDISSLVFNSDKVKAVLGIVEPTTPPTENELKNWASDLGVPSTTEQKPLWALYLEDSFNSVRDHLAEDLRKVLASDKAINSLGASVENYLVQKISQNKEALVLGLAYLKRWYNIDFGDLNTRDLTVFKQDFFGNQATSTLDVIIALGNSGYDSLRPKNNVQTYANSLQLAKGKATLFDYLSSYRQLFLPDKTNNEWLKDTSKAYIVEMASNVEEATKKQAQATPDSRYALGVYDRITKSNWAHQNMLLPLLTLPDESMYIISTMSTLSFGAYDRYLYDSASNGMKFEDYMHQIVDRAAVWQRDHFDYWYSILSEESREKLFQSVLNYDGFNFRDSASKATWKSLQNTERSSIANFFGPVGKWYAANGSGAYATGSLTHFVVDRMLDQYGTSVFTHEMVHNFDGGIYFEGNGRRQGLGAELFALGLLQAPNGNQARSLGINTVYSGNEDSITRYHAANPAQRYKNVADLNTYVHNMFDVIYLLDYLEAKSVLKQSDTVKQKWYRVIDNYYIKDKEKNTHAGNTIRQLTLEEATKLTTINDLVDNSIINRREYWDTHAGLTRNGYYTVSLFSPVYSALSNPNGSPGDFMFRRMAYELMAEKGYVEGFIPYVSNQLGKEAEEAGELVYDSWFGRNVGLITDNRVFKHIFKDEYADWATFKKAMYQNRINQLDNLVDFTMTYELDKPNSTKQVTISSFADLEKLMDEAVAQDMKSIDIVLAHNESSWVNVLKQRIYNALLRNTDDFRTSIFK
ncbi:TPA: G5 domain-containing protein [Streptococcus suis]|nr:G5 domain-containing protein [Streptococcus suis]HEM5102591.1 G5 domain-containing protein [Streptococcus suis]HEM5136141.1 G5 domain-containing protein [Streptococcus suis]